MRINYDAAYRQRLNARQLPLSGMLELTNRCNLDCQHCFVRVEGLRYRKKELPLKELLRIIDEIAQAGVIYLGLTGGEPLLHPHFKKIYLHARNKGLVLSVSTNATLVDRGTALFFRRYPPAAIDVCGYGYSAEAYEAVTRVRGSFRKYRRGMRLLQDNGIRMTRRFMVMRGNFDDTMRHIGRIEACGMRLSCGMPLVSRRDSDPEKNALIRAQQLLPEEAARILTTRKNRSSLDPANDPGCAGKCGAGTVAFSVDPYGYITGCQYIPRPAADLGRLSFGQGWKKIRAAAGFAQKSRRACGNCRFRARCFWCPGLAFLTTGRQDRKIPYLCRVMAHARQLL